MQAQKTRMKQNQTSLKLEFVHPWIHQAPLYTKRQLKSKQTNLLQSIFYSDEEVSIYQEAGKTADMVQQPEICQAKKEFCIGSKYQYEGKSSLPNKNKKILKEKNVKNQLIARKQMERRATRKQLKIASIESFLDQESKQQSQTSCKRLRRISSSPQPPKNTPQVNLFRYMLPTVEQNAMDQQLAQKNIQIQQSGKQKLYQHIGELSNKGTEKQTQTRGLFSVIPQNQHLKKPQNSVQQLQFQKKDIIRQSFVKIKSQFQYRKNRRQLTKKQLGPPEKDTKFRERSMVEKMQQQCPISNQKYIQNSLRSSAISRIQKDSNLNKQVPINQKLNKCLQRMEIQLQKMQQEDVKRENKRSYAKKRACKKAQCLPQAEPLLSREEKSRILERIQEINRASRISSHIKAKEHHKKQGNKQILSQLSESQVPKKKKLPAKNSTISYSPQINKCSNKLSSIAQLNQVKQEYEQKNVIQQHIDDRSESQLSQFVENLKYGNDFQNESMEMYSNRSKPKRLEILNRYNYNPFQEQPRLDQCRLWRMLMQEATQQDFSALFNKYTPHSQLLKESENFSKKIVYPHNLKEQHFELPTLYDPVTKSLKQESKQLFKGYQFSPITLSDKKASDESKFKGAQEVMVKQQVFYSPVQIKRQEMIPEKKGSISRLPEISQQRMSLLQKCVARRNLKKNQKGLNQSQKKFNFDSLEGFEIPSFCNKNQQIQIKMMNISPQGQQMPSEMELEFV